MIDSKGRAIFSPWQPHRSPPPHSVAWHPSLPGALGLLGGFVQIPARQQKPWAPGPHSALCPELGLGSSKAGPPGGSRSPMTTSGAAPELSLGSVQLLLRRAGGLGGLEETLLPPPPREKALLSPEAAGPLAQEKGDGSATLPCPSPPPIPAPLRPGVGASLGTSLPLLCCSCSGGNRF